ncbi:hypothetical protein CCHR01_10877 [Colletotrichum chrysophilum]|uniref:Uncharacterized protein n=1 Tax=Colletotrichum chrysophilum TaxID=1836956 RepID=A0AAD9AEW1_9PEZI|nr:hypothetical protein K456DRAFT_32285 [Colletotrichum gloeosporioides 23]KAK1846489.1 hypothetical protein CCHR01_10877 [Colletotrichum chrysophilum]
MPFRLTAAAFAICAPFSLSQLASHVFSTPVPLAKERPSRVSVPIVPQSMRGGFSSAAIKQDTTSAIQPLAHQRAGSQSPAGDPIAFDYHPTPLLWKRPKRWTAGSDTFGTSPCGCGPAKRCADMQQQESARGGGEETTTNQRRHTSRKSDIPPAMQRDKMGDPETASLPGPRPNQPIPSLKKLQTMGCAFLNRLQVLGPKNGSGWPRHERGTATISGSRTRNTPIGLSCLFFLSMESDTGTRTNRNCKVVRVLPPCREHGWLRSGSGQPAAAAAASRRSSSRYASFNPSGVHPYLNIVGTWGP